MRWNVVMESRANSRPRFVSTKSATGSLSGRNHRVFTGVAVVRDGQVSSRVNETRVTFKPLSQAEIAAYVAGGDWRGKAGGYGIQGPAGAFIQRIVGSHSSVMGLPLYEAVQLLHGVGWRA